MPTGCRSVYLFQSQHCTMVAICVGAGGEIPAGDLKGRAKDLSTYKLGHDDSMAEAGEEEEGLRCRREGGARAK